MIEEMTGETGEMIAEAVVVAEERVAVEEAVVLVEEGAEEEGDNLSSRFKV